MINALVALLGLQLLGEVLVRLTALPIPGPVVGAVLLTVILLLRGTIAPALADLSHGILRNLSLLFVPAAVGVVEYRALFAEHGLPLIATLILSTLAAMVAAALAFRWVSR